MIAVALAVRFALELCLLAALGVIGYALPDGIAVKVLLAIGAPGVAAAVWAAFLAPRAHRRLARAPRYTIELLLFATAVSGLAAIGYTGLAAAFGALYGIDKVILVAGDPQH